jgi:UPF0755 protein
MKWKLTIISAIIFILVFCSIIAINLSSPASFPTGAYYSVDKGVGLSALADDLKTKNIIKNPFWFKTFSVLFGGTKGIIAGDYFLDNKQNTILIAYKFSRGDFRLTPIKVTIPEGLNIFEIAKIISEKFPQIPEETFSELAKVNEGYLFPDTYFFLPNVLAQDILLEMNKNFNLQIKTLDIEIDNFGKPLSDIIKMASIIEKEARTMEARQIIAGILWKRISIGMPLQVDVSFKYINGKVTKDLTLADLKIDSPYNSYLYKGLPPTPIANPGLDSIKATIKPIKTDYLYFLSDKNGGMHYAKDYAEHLHNKELYLI